MNQFRNLVIVTMLSSAAVSTEAVHALESGDYVEEIVVTAQKREQLLQDVPIAMSVLDIDDLERRGFSRFDDIAFAVPNLSITAPSGSRSVQFTMRGITGQTFFPAAESSVGIFLDGVYVNNPAAQNFDLLDVERIEVLRGPQGTLYGKNAAAGAINVISRKPDEQAGFDVRAEYGDYDHQRLQAKGSGPVAEHLFGSFGVGYHQRDGFQKNPFLGSEFEDADAWNARGSLRYDAGGPLEIMISADYMSEDRVPAALDTSPDDRRSTQNFQAFEERDVYGVTVAVDYALSDTLSLVSSTAFRNYDLNRGNDSDGTTVDGFHELGTQETAQWSQEIRLASDTGGPLQWLAGAYYLNADMKDQGAYDLYPDELFRLLTGLTCTDLFTFQLIAAGFPPDQAAAFAAATCVDSVATSQVDHQTETWALFGQASYALAERLTLTAGVRVSWEEKTFDLRQPGPGAPLFLAAGVDEGFDRRDRAVDPMVSLMWHVHDQVNLYATAAKGSKSGGFNTGAIGSVAQLGDTEFDEETLLSYELGMKSTFLDGRVALNAAAFYIDYDDLQVFRIEANEQGVPSSRITNVAKASSAGAELDLTWAVAPGLLVRSSVGYTDATYDDYSQCGQNSAGVLIDCTDNRLTNAPEWTGNVNVTYSRPLSAGVSLMLNGEWSYRGDVYYDVFNNDTALQEGFSIYNASIGLTDPAGRWSATLWGTNLADEDYITVAVQGFGGNTIHTLGNPRLYGVRLTARF
jgi:iron complex outermembrane recepter protein